MVMSSFSNTSLFNVGVGNGVRQKWMFGGWAWAGAGGFEETSKPPAPVFKVDVWKMRVLKTSTMAPAQSVPRIEPGRVLRVVF